MNHTTLSQPQADYEAGYEMPTNEGSKAKTATFTAEEQQLVLTALATAVYHWEQFFENFPTVKVPENVQKAQGTKSLYQRLRQAFGQ